MKENVVEYRSSYIKKSILRLENINAERTLVNSLNIIQAGLDGPSRSITVEPVELPSTVPIEEDSPAESPVNPDKELEPVENKYIRGESAHE